MYELERVTTSLCLCMHVPFLAMEPRKPLTQPELDLWASLRVVMHTVPRALDAQLRIEAQISFTDFQALACLRDAGPQGMRVNELAECLGLSGSRATRIGKELVSRGDVSRHDGSGSRARALIISDVGRARLDEATTAYIAAARRHVFNCLEGRGLDLQGLADLFAHVARAL